VGVGTAEPTSTLHVLKSGAKLAVEDISPTVAVRNVIKLSNNGSVGFELEDTNLGNSWDFRTAANGGFLVSNIGVPGSKFQINTNGTIAMNGAGFFLNGNTNNVSVAGTHTALSYTSSSSRTVKQDFTKVDSKAVLEKIKDMEVTKWSYKTDSAKSKHIGPMAEDFYKLFGLGVDDKHVSATDMASIAIVAAKELQKENTALQAQLESQNKRLASLEKLVTNLASGQQLLPNTGDKVVLK